MELQGFGVLPEYLVETDRDAVARARTTVRRTLLVTAWVTAVGAGLIIGLTLWQTTRVDEGMRWSLALLSAVPGLGFATVAGRQFLAVRRLQEGWQANGILPVAARISAAGFRCGVEGAPDSVFLPWHALTGLRLMNLRGGRALVLELAPGVDRSTPGVIGLDHPDVQRALNSKVLGASGLRFAVSTLRQPLGEIDRAPAHYTGGRVRIR